ncbi:TPA: AAA family ATPase [Salmonella enterica subsp. enterica serovar Muenchen]
MIRVDEVEYGLEPNRISRLLHQLGSRDDEPASQVFISTHSPYVLRELKGNPALCTAETRTTSPRTFTQIPDTKWGRSGANTLRACAEAFFSKAVIVGEGGTEVGFIRGLDLFRQRRGRTGFQAQGAFATDVRFRRQ